MTEKKIYAAWVDKSVWPHKTIETMRIDLSAVDRISVGADGKIHISTNGCSSSVVCDEVIVNDITRVPESKR